MIFIWINEAHLKTPTKPIFLHWAFLSLMHTLLIKSLTCEGVSVEDSLTDMLTNYCCVQV
jgi:hypothetical protein